MKLAHISTSGKWRLSRPPARMLGAREPSIWDTTRQCHRPRSFVRMRAEHRRRRDGRWCGRRNSEVPRSIADPSFLLGARGLTQPGAPNPAQPVARWCQRRGPTDFPAATLAWITALSMPPVAKELTIEPRFMFGTDRYVKAVNPQREPIPDRSHQHRGQYGFGRWNAGKDRRHRAVRAPRDELTHDKAAWSRCA